MKSVDLHIIQSIFDHPLPGRAAHAVLAKNLGRENVVAPENARVAAVMILLLTNTSDELEIVFTERAVTDNADIHSGQMSFPGGKYDETDTDVEFTALRETSEEIGVSPELAQVLGKMTPLYIPVSNFIVHPYVGYIDHQPDFVMEEREVAEIVTSPLSYLLEYTEPSATDIIIRKGLTLKDVPYFNVKEKVVWGATSMMLNEFLWAIRQRLSS